MLEVTVCQPQRDSLHVTYVGSHCHGLAVTRNRISSLLTHFILTVLKVVQTVCPKCALFILDFPS